MNKSLLFLYLIFLSAFCGFSQSVRVLNLKDGLSNNYAQCILQDKSGYLWIGTRDGLNRYNGHAVEIFKDELVSDFIYSLMQDSRGRIWIGTSRGGITIYDPLQEKFNSLLNDRKKFNSLQDKDVYTMVEDFQHNFWIGTLQGLAYINKNLDSISWHSERIYDHDFSFTSIYEDPQHNLWFGTNVGLFKCERKNETDFDLKPIVEFQKIFIRDIKPDEDGNLWIATDDKGVYYFNRKNGAVKNYATLNQKLKGNQVWKIFIDSKKTVWAALIIGGLAKYDPVHDVFVSDQSRIASTFNSESITDILEDFNGNLWITSHGDGVCYFNPNRYVFEKYLHTNGIVVSSLMEDSQGTVWIGTDGDGLKKMSSNNTFSSLSTADGLSSNIILDIVEDQHQAKWLATWQGGVDYMAKDSRQIKVFNEKNKVEFGLQTDNVKALLKDSLNNIWMVSHGNGVFIYNAKQQKFIDPKSLSDAFTNDVARWGSDILQSKNGSIWIASHAGLFRFTGNNLAQYHATRTPNALASALIYCLYEDSDGTLWVGTNTSLEKYMPENDGFENYTKKYGVPGDIKCIVEDSNHQLWISTVNEIISLNLTDNTVRHFDKNYNVQEGQFYECACMKSKTGKLYFGGTEGFNAFHPDSITKDQFKARVLLTSLYLFNKKQKPNEQGSVLDSAMSSKKNISLAHSQNVVSFEFLALNYSAADKNFYQYKMDGFDKDWSPISESRLATYTNLDPGEYTFKVRTVLYNGIVLSEASTIVKIIPPFWKTLWFTLLASFVIAFSVVGFFVSRLHASRKKRLVLQQLVNERTKEVIDKNHLLEKQKEDLQNKNDALVTQEVKIREQASVLAQQKEQLQKNNATLEDLIATKDRLFSIIAHDLRNPFTSLIGFARLLNTDFNHFTDDEKKKLIRSLFHSSTSIYSLLENLLVWSKSQQQVLMFTPEKLQFKTIISEQFDLLKDEAEKKNVRLILTNGQEVSFFADRNMLNIILRNLLSNALKYSPIDGKIEVGYVISSNELKIYVKDEGTGIEKGAALFEVDKPEHRQRDHNHGLGLILCKEFVEKHGGTIQATNNQTKGATFSFTLPLSNPVLTENDAMRPVDEPGESSAIIESLPDGMQAQPLVLLVEDDDQIRWYIKKVLFPDFQVIEAVNGADGSYLAIEKNPDIIVSDLMMPKVDGLDLCKTIKSNSQTSHIPFIMLTAERSSDKKISGFEYGADDYINKPIEPNVLRARLHNMLETRKRLKAIYQKDITASPETFTSNPIDQSFLEKLNGVIEKQISNPDLNPDNLAREMSMSRTGLYMKIKALTGESVSIYIRNIRLKESKKLLKERKLNISEVAYAVGFNQLPYFTTCFKEAFGITPSEFIGSKNHH